MMMGFQIHSAQTPLAVQDSFEVMVVALTLGLLANVSIPRLPRQYARVLKVGAVIKVHLTLLTRIVTVTAFQTHSAKTPTAIQDSLELQVVAVAIGLLARVAKMFAIVPVRGALTEVLHTLGRWIAMVMAFQTLSAKTTTIQDSLEVTAVALTIGLMARKHANQPFW